LRTIKASANQIASWTEVVDGKAAPEQLFLHGGVGVLVAMDSTHLEYQVSDGEIWYFDNLNDEEVVSPQAQLPHAYEQGDRISRMR
jgi:hypothetical protein